MKSPLVVPIFPLESVVLLPGALLPLHVFEPRYRAMVRDAVAGLGMIAMAMPREGHSVADEVDPPVHGVVQLGRIVRHEPYDDGRADIVLEGVARMRIEQELPTEHAYRRVQAEPLPDVPVSDADALTARLSALLTRFPDLRDDDLVALRTIPAGRATDALLMRLPIPAREKHRVLAEPDPLLRIDTLHRVLGVLTGRPFSLDVGRGDPRLN